MSSNLRLLLGTTLCFSALALCTAPVLAEPDVSTKNRPRPRLLERIAAGEAAHDPLRPAYCFVPNPTPEQEAEIMRRYNALPPSMVTDFGPRFFTSGTVWTGNGLQGSSGRAASASLTYSFPADGVSWGSPAGTNNLTSKFAEVFGAANVDRGRELTRQGLASWRRFGGLTYTEVADDNSAFSTEPARLNTRGDIRIGSISQGTSSGVLAYNFFPSGGGDMTINSDYFASAFSDASNNYRYLRNVVSHEHGHGLGFIHPVPCNGTKLMEPFLNTGFDGTQIDERRGAGRNHGDRYAGNNSGAAAKDFGNLTTPALRSVVERNLSTNGTAGVNNTDEDWFKFTIDSAQDVTITATATGGTYDNGQQTSGCNGTISSIIASQAGNLNVELRIGTNGGTVIQTANFADAGLPETVSAPGLAAGTYWVRVVDVGPNAHQTVQLYDLTVRIGTTGAPPVAMAGLHKRIAANANCFFMGNINSYGTDAPVVSYAWDLDGDGVFGGAFDSNSATPGVIANVVQANVPKYVSNGVYNVTLRVTDSVGRTATDAIQVTVTGATAAVTGVSPNTGASPATVPVTITGRNFKGVTSASQITVGGGGVTVSGTPVVNGLGTQITGLTFSIASGFGDAVRDITVSNSDGSGTASGAATGAGLFTVIGVCVPPSVLSDPSPRTACPGTAVQFTVSAGGTQPLFQWRKGGTNIQGATGASLTIDPVGPTDGGTYDCVITNNCGSATSNGALLTVDSSGITAGPASQAVCVGAPVTLSVAAVGATNFQWRKDGTDLTGATGSTLAFATAQLVDSGSYDCVVTTGCGTTTSSAATLQVGAPVSIVGSPPSQSICSGGSATLTVSVTGTPSGFQWRKTGVNIPGATGPSLMIGPATTGDSGVYDCVVSAICGGGTSGVAVITVASSPTFTHQPVPQFVCLGVPASFSVGVDPAAGPVTYQWRRNGNPITGATGPTYSIALVTNASAGAYTCVVVGACGSGTSEAGQLGVIPGSITSHPLGQQVCEGGSIELSVGANGSNSFQWRKNGNAILGATDAELLIAPAALADTGSYDCQVSTSCGLKTSNAALVTVGTPLSITAQPTAQAVCLGGSAGFTISASGVNPNYRWRRAGVVIAGATAPTLTISPVLASDGASYDCEVHNGCGTVLSAPALLMVGAAASITSQPMPTAVCEGSAASLTVGVSGSPTGYQWRKAGFDLAGATGPTLTINPAGASDAGEYDCVISTACGSITSSAATLTVCAAVAINGQPVGAAACPGQSVTLSVAATGGGLAYQWRKGGLAISGATAASLAFTPVVSSDAGWYDCVVSNCCQSVVSATAIVTLCKADFNCSTTVTVADIFAFLAAWFANDPRADFDGSGTVTVSDIFGFLTAWFAGC